MQEGSGEQDVRILSLKRLDTLFASDRNIERICKYGQYISANCIFRSRESTCTEK